MLVPFILHLILHWRRKVVELSTFRFLFETYFREGRAMKLLEYLLLALRMLALLLLGLFFARPAISPGGIAGFGSAPRAMVLVVDSSASMSATDSGIARLEMARELVREFLARSRPGDEISLVNSHYDADVLAAHVTGDIPLILARLDSIRPTHRTGRIGPALSRAAAILRESPLNRKVIYFFSDLQKSALDQYPHESEQAILEKDMSVCLVRIGEASAENCALMPDPTPRTRAFVHVPTTMRMRLANFSTARKDVLFTLTPSDPGKEQGAPVRRELLSLQPGEQKLLETVYTFEEPGFHSMDFQISGDAFVPDDQVTVTLPVFPVAQVLLAATKTGPTAAGDSGFYIARALQPELTVQDPRKILVQQTFCDPAQLSAGNMAGKHVVILSNVSTLPPAAVAGLKQFVAAGGGMLVFCGESADPAFYASLAVVSNDLHGAFLPGAPVRTYSGQDDPTRFTYFSSMDFQHPVFALFQGAHATSLTMPRFYRIWELRPSEGRPARSIAAFSIGLDAIREHRYGQGKVILCSFPAQVGWSSFPLKPAFVPLLHQMVAYLCPEDWKDQLRETEVDEPFRLVLPHALRMSELTLTDPAGKSARLQFRPDGDSYAAATNLSEKGSYQLLLKRTDNTTDTAWLATRLAARESLFESLTEQGARRLIPNASVTLVSAGPDVSRVADQLTAGRPLWRGVAWITAFILLLEFLLANRLFLPPVPPRWRETLFAVRRFPWHRTPATVE